MKAIAWLVLLAMQIACTKNEDSFKAAIDQAKSSGYMQVNQTQSGVPFYSVKTLDPNWEEAGSTPIVKLSGMTLLNQDGKPIRDSFFDGKISILTFFFSSCSGFCPVLIRSLQKVESKVESLGQIQYVGVSVDPERDQPSVLKTYYKKMKLKSNAWTLTTGDHDTIYSFARETLASEAFKLTKSEGQIAHSQHFYIFDSKRRLRGIVDGTSLAAPDKAFDIIASIKKSREI
jgi:protein SCO1/2